MEYNYCLYEKRKNKKYIIAVWYPNTEKTCRANASDCFEMHGYKVNINYDFCHVTDITLYTCAIRWFIIK